MASGDLNNTLSHLALSCVAGHGLYQWGHAGEANWTNVGMFSNFFVHGVLGVLNYQKPTFGLDVQQLFDITLKATKFLPLACLNGELYYHIEKYLGGLHLASGFIPFIVSLQTKDYEPMAKVVSLLNIISLVYYSHDKDKEWGYYTAGASFVTYFLAIQGASVLYPLGLALMNFCVYKMY